MDKVSCDYNTHVTKGHVCAQIDPRPYHSTRGQSASEPDDDTANLEAWVTHAQSLKPGGLMPNLTQFDGPQLGGLVAYLQALR